MKKLVRVFTFLGIILFLVSCDKKPESDTPIETKPTVSINDISSNEGNMGSTEFTFTITLDKSTEINISVDYLTRDVSALSGTDYEAKSGTLIIPAGAIEGQIKISIVSDLIIESNESFELNLISAINATIGRSVGTATIINDDTLDNGGDPANDEGYITPDSYPGLILVWSDEFNGTELSANNWSYETGGGGWGNNELQVYRNGTDNATVANGKLTIEAKNELGSYTSARIVTRGKQSFKYGRVDIRARLPQGQGLWPALWMIGESFSNVGWPACGEIDIMELVGHQPNQVHGTVHWQNEGNHASYGDNTVLSSGTFTDEFNVFSIIWNSQEIKWYMNDNLYHTITITGNELTEFQEEFFFIFNVAVGGNWPGYPDASTQFPQQMIVDYVRVFQ